MRKSNLITKSVETADDIASQVLIQKLLLKISIAIERSDFSQNTLKNLKKRKKFSINNPSELTKSVKFRSLKVNVSANFEGEFIYIVQVLLIEFLVHADIGFITPCKIG